MSSPSLSTEKNFVREENYDSTSNQQINVELELNKNEFSKEANLDDAASINITNKTYSFISSSSNIINSKKNKSNLKKKQESKLNINYENQRSFSDFHKSGSFFSGIVSNILSPLKKVTNLDPPNLCLPLPYCSSSPITSFTSNEQSNYFLNHLMASLQNNNTINKNVFDFNNQFDNQYILNSMQRFNANSNQLFDKLNINLLKPMYPIMVFKHFYDLLFFS